MDLQTLGMASVAVFAILYVTGFLGISVLSGYLQCSKINWSVSAAQGAIWAAFPTVLFAIAMYLPIVRNPFSNTLSSFGVPENLSDRIAVGYLLMLLTWIVTVYVTNNTEKQTCTPDVAEMSEFKKKLLAELQQKQIEEEKNKEPEKNNGVHITTASE